MSTNLTTLAFAKETTLGVAVTASAAFSYLKHVGESLKTDLATARSGGFTPDRRPQSLYPTGRMPSGGISGKLAVGSHDEFLPGAFMATDWVTSQTTTAALTVVAATRTVTMIAAFTNMIVGDVFKIDGSASTGANDGLYQILTRTSDDEVIVETFHSLAGGDETATADVTISHTGYCDVGVVLSSWNLEKNLRKGAASLDFHQSLGMAIDTMTLKMGLEGELEIELNFKGMKCLSSVATAAVGAITAATTVKAVRSVTGLKGFFIKGLTTPAAYRVRDWSLTVNNNIRQDKAQADDLDNVVYDIEPGNSEIAGTMEIYFSSRDIYTQFLAFTSLGCLWHLQDPQGGKFALVIDELNFTAVEVNAGGENQPVVANITFEASEIEASDRYVRLYRFAA